MDVGRRRFLSRQRDLAEQRPPWLLDPAAFTDACTRCGNCVDLCPQGILRAGSGGFPKVDFSAGECTFCGECTRQCEQALFHDCDSTKPWTHHAVIADNCLTRFGVMCRSCEDSCEPRAIHFRLTVGAAASPVIDTDACTGCGACIRPCPAKAISMELGD